MSGTDRDLVTALRAEVAAIDPSRACDRQAEIAGLGPRVHAREPAVARLVIRLGGHAREGGGASRRAFLLPDADLDWATAPEHCRTAWLRGRFLARGSLSLSAGRAHLEFVVPPDEAPLLAARLGDVDLPASWRIRRGSGVVTWKSSESDRLVPGPASARARRSSSSRPGASPAPSAGSSTASSTPRAPTSSGPSQRPVASWTRSTRSTRTAASPSSRRPSGPWRRLAARRPRRRCPRSPSASSCTARPCSDRWTGWSASRCTMTRASVAGTGPGHPVPVPGSLPAVALRAGRRAAGGPVGRANGRARLA